MQHASFPRIHTFIATSDIHMKHKLKKSREEVLEITRCVRACVRACLHMFELGCLWVMDSYPVDQSTDDASIKPITYLQITNQRTNHHPHAHHHHHHHHQT